MLLYFRWVGVSKVNWLQAVSRVVCPERLHLCLQTFSFILRMAVPTSSLSEDITKTSVIVYL